MFLSKRRITVIVALISVLIIVYLWQLAGFSPRLPFPQIYHLTLDARPVLDNPRTFIFTTRITGGVRFAPGLHCSKTTWDLGNGRLETRFPFCSPWWNGVDFPHGIDIERTHAYEQPGIYTSVYSYGWLESNPVTVVVP